ncbi:MAG: hypothetical protein LBC40_02795 [Dysgonamonadaceae bacterium]|nr:hypothetical protein [Dysgonamonadaceae bacterium]
METKENDPLEAAIKEFDAASEQLTKALEEAGKTLRAFPDSALQSILNFLKQAKTAFAVFNTPLTTEDRKRMLISGIKSQGFIERAYASAEANTALLPPYLPISKFKNDVIEYERMITLYSSIDQFEQDVYDSMAVTGNTAYHDALAYYNEVKQATAQRVSGAEAVYNDLKVYFKHSRPKSDTPTEAQIERDVRALLHGTKEGKVVIKNEHPVASGGERKVVDEVYSGRSFVERNVEADEKAGL